MMWGAGFAEGNLANVFVLNVLNIHAYDECGRN